jgi:DNA-binding NarL/FixJ family response regulator
MRAGEQERVPVTGPLRLVRATLADMSPRLRDIVSDILVDEPDIQIVESTIDQLRRAGADPCDVLVTEAAGDDIDQWARELLRLVPCGGVVVITAKGDRAVVHGRRQQRYVLSEVSLGELAKAIRETVRSFDT